MPKTSLPVRLALLVAGTALPLIIFATERSARDQLGGEATVDFLPRGVVYTLVCLLDDM